MKLSLTTLFAATVVAIPAANDKRQSPSTTWRYDCTHAPAPVGNFKAFDLGGCTAQLSFDKDRYVGVQWAFEATYADGSRAEHKPFRPENDFGASDTFYPNVGTNYITRLPGKSAFTAVHEFANVCKNGAAPVSWRFYTTSTSTCMPANYRYTTGQVRSVSGVSRPATVSGVSLRRANDEGEFAVSWAAVSRAAAYSVIVQYPTGTDDLLRPYVNLRGARVQVSFDTL